MLSLFALVAILVSSAGFGIWAIRKGTAEHELLSDEEKAEEQYFHGI